MESMFPVAEIMMNNEPKDPRYPIAMKNKSTLTGNEKKSLVIGPVSNTSVKM